MKRKIEKEKKICRLLLNVCITVTIPLLIIPICITIKPAKFLDEEAAYYIENKDFERENDENIRVLIMGDSCGKADWVPNLLGMDVYNYALGGGGPIDEYYTLENYLENNEAPEYVVYTMSSWYFTQKSFFWERTVYFHRLKPENLLDLKKFTANYREKDCSALDMQHVFLKYLGYELYLPQNYSRAFFEGLFNNVRLESNMDQYEYARSERGHVLYGQADSHDELTPFFTEHFKYNEILADYFYRTIELCEANDIKFIFQSPPLNPSSYTAICEVGYLDEYTAFLENVQKKYPDVCIETAVPMYDADCFGDVHHLNAHGSETFTKEMAEKYNYIFE